MFKNMPVILSAVLLILVSLQSNAVEFDESKYDVYYGDFNGDGQGGDIYFHSIEQTVMLHGDIIIPIVLNRENGFIYYAGQGSTAHTFNLNKSQLGAYQKAVLGIDYFFDDLNGDGVIDLRVSAHSGGSRGANVYGSRGDELPVEVVETGSITPVEFNYDIERLPLLPDLGEGEFVALTKGQLSVSGGVANYDVPMVLPPGVNKLVPSLSLSYNSANSTSGIMGVGWSVTGFSTIHRCRKSFVLDGVESQKSNPKYSHSDRLCLDGERLQLFEDAGIASDSEYWASGATYRTEREAFIKVEAHGNDNDDHAYFVVYKKNGLIFHYGRQQNSQESRIYAAGRENQKVKTWALDKVEDRYGNYYSIHYNRDIENGSYYPSHVSYDPGATVVFNYSDRALTTQNGYRPDVPWGYDTGYRFQRNKLLKSVTTYINSTAAAPSSGTPVRHYDIDYKRSITTHRYLVNEIKECGFDAFGALECARPLAFNWQEGELGYETTETVLQACSGGDLPINTFINGYSANPMDVDSDGYIDIVYNVGANDATSKIYWGTEDGCFNEQNMFSPKIHHQDQDQLFLLRTPQGNQPVVLRIRITSIKMYKIDYDKVNRTYTKELVLTLSGKDNFGGFSLLDINNDGLTDYAMNGLTSSRVYLQRNSASLEFEPMPIDFPFGFGQFFAQRNFDLNSDGTNDTQHYLIRSGEIGNRPYGGFASPGWNGNQLVSPVSLNSQFSFPYSVCTTYMTGAPFDKKNVANGVFNAFADLNGDGNTDYLYQGGNGDRNNWYPVLGDGNNLNASVPEVEGVIAESLTSKECQVIWPLDYNKDGLQDLLLVGEDGISYQLLITSFENGKIHFERTNIDVFGGKESGQLGGTLLWGVNHFTGDVNNDGIPDAFFKGTPIKFYLGKTQKPDLISSITNGLMVEDQIAYSTLTGDDNNGRPLYLPTTETLAPEVIHGNRAQQVVKNIKRSDGLGGFRETYYYYRGAKTHFYRGSLGFEKIDIVNYQKGVQSSIYYRQDYPFNGLSSKKIDKSISNLLIGTTENKYTLHPQNPSYIIKTESISKRYDLTTPDESQPLSVSKTEFEWDQYGGLDKQTTTIGIDYANGMFNHYESKIEKDVTLVNDPQTWLLGFISSKQTTYYGEGGGDIQSTRSEFRQEAGTLDVETSIAFLNTPQQITTTFIRNERGIITLTRNTGLDIDSTPLNVREQSLSHFDQVMYPKTLINAEGHEITTAYDKRFGEVSQTTDANELVLSTAFDSLGRNLYSVDYMGVKTKTYNYYCTSERITCPAQAMFVVASEVVHETNSNQKGAPLSLVYFDALERIVRKEVFSFNGESTKIDTQYDALGRVYRKSNAYTGVSATHWSEYTYDALGRTTHEVHPDGGGISITYGKENGFTKKEKAIMVVSPSTTAIQNGVEYINSLGQVVRVVDTLQIPIDYTYDSKNQLTTTVINNNLETQISIKYDIAGNKTELIDPDSGKINYEYNAFKELRKQIWEKDTANEKSIVYSYDKLGRKVGRMDTDAQGVSISYLWEWDTRKKGLLTKQEGNGITEHYYYNDLAQLTRQTSVIEGLGARSFIYSYDDFGRIQTMTYPSGLTIEDQYHINGEKVRTYDISNAIHPKLLWQIGDQQDMLGNYRHQIFGNGVVTETGMDINGRVERIVSGFLGENTLATLPANIQNLSYEYDSLNNLMSRTTERTSDYGVIEEYISESFGYDAGNRLTDTLTTDYFGIRQHIETRYNELGNLIHKTGVGDLLYQKTGNASIHAVTQNGSKIYEYDVYGNMARREGKAIQYNVFNKPVYLDGTTFKYGPNHNRFKQTNGNKVTYYLGGGTYEEVVTAGTTTQKSYVGGYFVQEKTNSEIKTSYLHYDHLGSIEAISDEFGYFVTRLSFDPWGKRQKDDWEPGLLNPSYLEALPTTKGFTGHEQLDHLGLIHMNGRVYDPMIGRFLSADILIQAPNNSQNYNRYTYVMNNPLSLVDPTGYSSDSSSRNENPAGVTEEVVVVGVRTQVSNQGGIKVTIMFSNGTSESASEAGESLTFKGTDGALYKVELNGSKTTSKFKDGVENTLTTHTWGQEGEISNQAGENGVEVLSPLEALEALLVVVPGVGSGSEHKTHEGPGYLPEIVEMEGNILEDTARRLGYVDSQGRVRGVDFDGNPTVDGEPLEYTYGVVPHPRMLVTKSSLRRIKRLIQNLSSNSNKGNGLSQGGVNKLKRIVEKAGGRLRNDGAGGKKGSSAGEPHVQIEGMGGKIKGRHIWTEPGVKL